MSGAAREIAVIIVTFRSARLTIDCLRSLLPERESPNLLLRAVVVDNASGDYEAIFAAVQAEGWGQWVTLLEAPRNGGFGYGNNLGLVRALRQGAPEYFHILNPDTRIKPGAVLALSVFLDANPHVGLAGSSFENGDGSDWPIAFRFPTALSEVESGIALGLVSRLLARWRVPRIMSREPQPMDWGAGASMMIRRSVVEAIGGFDENYFLYFEESEFFWRARQAGFPAWYVPASRVIHIAGQSTKLTERDAAPRRLPDYWFASRRRYFLQTLGLQGAMWVDVCALSANALGHLKRTLQGRQKDSVPYYVRDLWRHSVLWPRNRAFAPRQTKIEWQP